MFVIAAALVIFDRAAAMSGGKPGSESALLVYKRQAVERAKRVLDVEREDLDLW